MEKTVKFMVTREKIRHNNEPVQAGTIIEVAEKSVPHLNHAGHVVEEDVKVKK